MHSSVRGPRHLGLGALGASLLFMSASAGALTTVTVTIENLAPVQGNFLTPVWVGFHDGNFDLFDTGSAASAGLEALAEDGNVAPLNGEFANAGGGQTAVIPGPNGPIGPGDVTTMTFTLDENNPDDSYFSFAAMVLPSNDAFIGSGNAISLFDSNGNFTAVDFFVGGANVYDAGTEVNDELPANTAFFGQMMPNTGVTEGGVVALHSGFLPAGSGGILDDPMFANADFTRANYPIAQIRISAVPLPAAAWLMLSGIAGLGVLGRRRKEVAAS